MHARTCTHPVVNHRYKPAKSSCLKLSNSLTKNVCLTIDAQWCNEYINDFIQMYQKFTHEKHGIVRSFSVAMHDPLTKLCQKSPRKLYFLILRIERSGADYLSTRTDNLFRQKPGKSGRSICIFKSISFTLNSDMHRSLMPSYIDI